MECLGTLLRNDNFWLSKATNCQHFGKEGDHGVPSRRVALLTFAALLRLLQAHVRRRRGGRAAMENGVHAGAGAGPTGTSLVTKVLNKRADSVRDLKPGDAKGDAKAESGGRHSKKGKENKKESAAGLPQLTQPAQPRGSSGSCTSNVSGGAAPAVDKPDGGKEVKFRDPESSGAEEASGASAGDGVGAPGSPKVPHKFISNWKHACDKTRDRTRDLLKRWRTAPEGLEHGAAAARAGMQASQPDQGHGGQGGWSVHVWDLNPGSTAPGTSLCRHGYDATVHKACPLGVTLRRVVFADELVPVASSVRLLSLLGQPSRVVTMVSTSAPFGVLEIGDRLCTCFTLVEVNIDNEGGQFRARATWVKRLPSEEEGFLKQEDENSAALLSPVQREKLSQFFSYLFDGDRDDIVSRQDFENLSERLRHFADWSDNSSEYHILREVEHNFISTFLEPERRDDGGGTGASPASWGPEDGVVVCPTGERERVCSLDQWLSRWGAILDKAKTFNELPVWLQYFPRVMFHVINKSGTGVVSRDELSAFYSSVLGLGAQRVGEVLDSAYKAMTANGDHPLCFPAYRWCYANFLLGRHRNGPGQYLFGPGEAADVRSCPFPVDYSALNTAPEELEQYSPDRKSNRRSVVV
ncbi:Sarcoplasmic calcium-binding proteins I, III, and IV [Frankliniella fusca]|uniref:Sarcoplasmic calcium-binding proteins I, III, and IV n=1 Tax=Frankliniella fusca TaxID=407009 RepID=A0AAE1HDI7_9NEOP|nr:Sarcoplasmic calcium-binding proteins I, III, and IV [Frankliniella fusca]